jgi:queuosine precursor transporter
MNRNATIAVSVGGYILAILLVNYTFVVLPPIASPFGDLFVANLIVGAVFVLRDYAQRAIGHWVLLATLVAGLLTWAMVDPGLALASLVAFVLSEMTDWAVYSFTKRPLQSRIWMSALISVPVDTLVFQWLGSRTAPQMVQMTGASVAVEIISKAVGVAIVWYLLKLRVGNSEPVAAH